MDQIFCGFSSNFSAPPISQGVSSSFEYVYEKYKSINLFDRVVCSKRRWPLITVMIIRMTINCTGCHEFLLKMRRRFLSGFLIHFLFLPFSFTLDKGTNSLLVQKTNDGYDLFSLSNFFSLHKHVNILDSSLMIRS